MMSDESSSHNCYGQLTVTTVEVSKPKRQLRVYQNLLNEEEEAKLEVLE